MTSIDVSPSEAAADDRDPRVVEAVGKITEALERTHRARGHLYSFHQLTGEADLDLDEAVALLREAGQDAMADRVSTDLIGRNVIEGRWTFQIVEEYDDTYYDLFRTVEQEAREQLTDGKRHLYEARLKAERRTAGHPHHTEEPPAS